jgi:hypothetical protein
MRLFDSVAETVRSPNNIQVAEIEKKSRAVLLDGDVGKCWRACYVRKVVEDDYVGEWSEGQRPSRISKGYVVSHHSPIAGVDKFGPVA